MEKPEKKRKKRRIVYFFAVLFAAVLGFSFRVLAAQTLRVEFFYQEVCASCDGTEEFFEIYDQIFTEEERAGLNVEIATYNVFMESNEEYYRKRAEEQGIPEGEQLPVLIAGDRWVSGYEAIESSLKELLLEQDTEKARQDGEEQGKTEKEQTAAQAEETADAVKQEAKTVLVLFTTNACEDCEKVKKWIGSQEWLQNYTVIEWNIIEDECTGFLKQMFHACEVEEGRRKVPAVFAGDFVWTGTKEILSVTEEQIRSADNGDLRKLLASVKEDGGSGAAEDTSDFYHLLTLAGAGFLAGFNPCSVSMLLMLLSLLLGARVSVWKNGLTYLGGKYLAYFSIGMVIFVTASQISQKTLDRAGRILDVSLAVLFLAAAALYLTDAVKIFRQDYGHIRTQLPVGLRKANHRLIRNISGMSGVMQPLLILGLGAAIALGEFFCTGQIYMASITYLLKDGEAAVWLPFLVYVTAMSLPALAMVLLIQKTRNTERISDFMFRHLGAIKVCNAVLFLCFAVYFLAV